MIFNINIFSLTLVILGLATAIMSVVIYRRMGDAVRWFGAMMMAIAIWAVGYGIELSCISLSHMRICIDIEYLGIALLPATWIVFIIKFIGKDKWLTNRMMAAIFFIPLTALILVWTNPWHHFYYSVFALDNTGPFPLLSIKAGPWYIVHTIYFYLMLASGTYLLITKFRKANITYKRQNRAILIATIIPWFVNMLYLLDLRPFKHIDLTPYGFIITALIICFGLLKFRLFDIIPIARDTVIEALNEGLLVIDRLNRVVDLNPAMRKFIAPYVGDPIGLTIDALLPNETKLHELVQERINSKTEVKLREGDNDRFYEVIITTLFEQNTIHNGLTLLFRDITETKVAAQKLKEQAEQLSALNDLKDKLFSIIAHDLRSPIVSLMGILNMTEEGTIEEEEFKALLPVLSKNISYTSGLLENLLYWSRSQLKGESIYPVYFDLKIIAADQIRLFEKRATDKNILITNHISTDTLVYADMDMIQLVLRNLLANAIKFCRKNDHIEITATANAYSTRVCILDTGIGIQPEFLSKLFGMSSFSTRGTDNEHGTGLGLLLCKDFIERNHGQIWAESKLNVGSKFYFEIPNAPLEHK